MKKLTLIALLSLTALLPIGCANMPAIVRELGKDHNNVTVQVTTIYGNLRYARTGATNATANADGSLTAGKL